MNYQSDADEVFTSVRSDVMAGDHCTCGVKFRTGEDFRDHMPCPGTPQFQETEKWRIRCELAEKVADMLVEQCAGISGFTADADTLETALVAWEKARGRRRIFTDGDTHVIASGRGGLIHWLVEYGYDLDQSEWELVPDETPIDIICDKDGMPCDPEDAEEDSAGRTLTAKEWVELVKEDGMLCSTEG
jgi:hypothetical protein